MGMMSDIEPIETPDNKRILNVLITQNTQRSKLAHINAKRKFEFFFLQYVNNRNLRFRYLKALFDARDDF